MHASLSLTLSDVIAGHAQASPDREALVCGDQRISFGMLTDRVARLSAGLARLGVGAGDRVLWLGKNCHAVIELLVACGDLGAMLCPGNWRGSAEERAFLVDDLRPAVAFYDPELQPDTREIDPAGRVPAWIPIPDYERVLDDGHGRRVAPQGDPSLPALVLYTGAFGGRPSGSMLTQGNLVVQSLVWMWGWAFDASTIYLACGPLFHIATWMAVVPALHARGKVVVAPNADAEQVCALIERERCTNGLVLPPTIEKILEVNRDGRYDLSSFRSFVRMPGWTEMVVPDDSPLGRSPGGYGQTEVTGSALISALGPRPDDFTSGLPSPAARVRLIDDDGDDVPDGEVGEIAVGGPIVHAGYWNRPEANERRLRDGWWRTQDLGRRNPDGSISFIGPKARMIKSGMENIYPAEIERCLEEHPGVREAAVIGVPDDRWVQSVKAIVVADPDRDLAADDVVDWCQRHLASYKKPRAVTFVDRLPRQGPAKDYDALDAQHGGGGYPGGTTSYLASQPAPAGTAPGTGHEQRRSA